MVFQAGIHEPIEGGVKEDAYDFGGQTGIYIPSFRNVGGQTTKDFLRGYSLLGSVGRISPGWFFIGTGEMLPRAENRVEIDSAKKDGWGIPAARITCVHSENERAMVRDMKEAIAQLASDCGLEANMLGRESLLNKLVYQFGARFVYTPDGALVPGSAIHEAGGARMGADPRTSVLNGFNQCWDAKNVFVTDSASFTTSPFQNPGLPIMALSARASAYIADALTRGNLRFAAPKGPAYGSRLRRPGLQPRYGPRRSWSMHPARPVAATSRVPVSPGRWDSSVACSAGPGSPGAADPAAVLCRGGAPDSCRSRLRRRGVSGPTGCSQSAAGAPRVARACAGSRGVPGDCRPRRSGLRLLLPESQPQVRSRRRSSPHASAARPIGRPGQSIGAATARSRGDGTTCAPVRRPVRA